MYESVRNQVHKDDAANNMRPNINGLIMEHKQALQQLAIAIKVDSVASLDVLIVSHE